MRECYEMNEIEKLENAIKTIEAAIAEVEWECPMDYAIAFETAIEALREKLEREKNPPLTLSEITSEQFNMFTGCVFLETPYELRNYGVTWLAYRYKKGDINDT